MAIDLSTLFETMAGYQFTGPALNIATQVLVNTGAMDKAVDTWLATGQSTWGKAAHWAICAGSSLSQYGRSKGASSWSSISTMVIPMSAASRYAVNVMNKLMEPLMIPNLEGIPLWTARIESERNVDISESAVLVQSEMLKQYRTDNVVPKLRTWSIDGYLQSLMLTLDGHSIIKSTIQLQLQLIDSFMKSRRPMWFKTNLAEFVQVQIESFHNEWNPEATNATHITMQLKEYKPLVVNSGFMAIITAAADAVPEATQ